MTSEIDVIVHEVGPRDGLQSIETIFSTDAKIDWIQQEAESGVRMIQVGSFVPPKLLPQMADTAEVVRRLVNVPDLTVSALVPNVRGAENAMAVGTGIVGFVLSVSEAHNLKNVRRSVHESLEQFSDIVEHRDEIADPSDIIVSGSLATAFGCTIDGQVPISDVMRVAEEYLKRGADRISVADTVGYAGPAHVKSLFDELFRTIGRSIPVGAHFHDTRGLGLANVYAALESGVREFDASLGGLGGCPYAPGATGNIVTEDLVFMLESMGLRTGINLDGLLEAREIMEQHLGGEPTHGSFINAGRPLGFQSASAA